VRDSQSGYRAMKAMFCAGPRRNGDRYEFETDFIIRAARAGFTTVNSTDLHYFGSPSYFREFRDAWLVIKVLWRHRAGYKALRLLCTNDDGILAKAWRV